MSLSKLYGRGIKNGKHRSVACIGQVINNSAAVRFLMENLEYFKEELNYDVITFALNDHDTAIFDIIPEIKSEIPLNASTTKSKFNDRYMTDNLINYLSMRINIFNEIRELLLKERLKPYRFSTDKLQQTAITIMKEANLDPVRLRLEYFYGKDKAKQEQKINTEINNILKKLSLTYVAYGTISDYSTKILPEVISGYVEHTKTFSDLLFTATKFNMNILLIDHGEAGKEPIHMASKIIKYKKENLISTYNTILLCGLKLAEPTAELIRKFSEHTATHARIMGHESDSTREIFKRLELPDPESQDIKPAHHLR